MSGTLQWGFLALDVAPWSRVVSETEALEAVEESASHV